MVDPILVKALELGASDVHFSVGVMPAVRRFGQLRRMKTTELTAQHTQRALEELLTPEQKARFAADHELDFAYELPGVARFRCNAFLQRRGIDICFRLIKATMPSFAELGIPEMMKKVCDNHQGLILVTGSAGSGKSTTLAAMVDFINSTRAHHVLTVEDPIEFVHPVKKAAVNQRELGRHTESYANALRAALREDPDVIMVGELRDLETITLAMSASETGHLVIGSMNTSSAHKTVDKIIDSYPPAQQNQIRAMLGESLKAVFSQRLLPRADGAGVVLAYELLLGSVQLATLIKEGKSFQIQNLMQTGKSRGLRQLDDSLMELLQKQLITGEVAYRNATNPRLFAAAAGVAEQPAKPGGSR
jgi:twitching motility protein PilT